MAAAAPVAEQTAPIKGANTLALPAAVLAAACGRA